MIKIFSEVVAGSENESWIQTQSIRLDFYSILTDREVEIRDSLLERFYNRHSIRSSESIERLPVHGLSASAHVLKLWKIGF